MYNVKERDYRRLYSKKKSVLCETIIQLKKALNNSHIQIEYIEFSPLPLPEVVLGFHGRY